MTRINSGQPHQNDWQAGPSRQSEQVAPASRQPLPKERLHVTKNPCLLQKTYACPIAKCDLSPMLDDVIWLPMGPAKPDDSFWNRHPGEGRDLQEAQAYLPFRRDYLEPWWKTTIERRNPLTNQPVSGEIILTRAGQWHKPEKLPDRPLGERIQAARRRPHVRMGLISLAVFVLTRIVRANRRP